MKMKLVWSLLVTVACLCGANNLAAKADAFDNGFYTTKDKEFYLTPEQLLFIRPGLVVEILEVVLPADMQLEVTYSIEDPSGLPLDHDGVHTPGVVDMRLTLSNIPMGEEQKVRLAYERVSRNGTLTSVSPGVYKYKFETVLASDLDTTHTLVLGSRRDVREFDLDRYTANDLYDWVPSGMYDAMPRDIVTAETCNRCHDPLAMHGSRWLSPAACGQCHNPGLIGRDGESKSLNILVHHVHEGLEAFPAPLNACETCHVGGTPTENFPLVANPSVALVCDHSGSGETTLSWQYAGDVEIQVSTPASPDGKVFARGGKTGSAATGKWVKDGTVFGLYDAGTMELVQSVKVNATVLGCSGNAPGAPRGEAGVQHTNWMDHPARAVCGACHNDIDFETGEGHSVQTTDDNCHFCHKPSTGNEFDISVKGAHQLLVNSAQFPGVLVELLDVMRTDPGDYPKVLFSVVSKDALIDPATLNRLRFTITGPNEDFEYYNRETVGDKAVTSGNNWLYAFENPIPADAAGSYTVSVEGRADVDIDKGDGIESERDVIQVTQMEFAVTDAVAERRRMVVDDEKCESCHVDLSLHGGGRNNANYCITCHAPNLVDIATPAESVNFKWMIHKIHRGADLENGYIVVRSRGTYDFSDIEFPGDLRNCEACHVNDSYQLPLQEGLLPQITPNFWWDPIEPVASACLGCHDSDDASAHAYANTTFFGESCSTCHGEGKIVSVDKVHAH